MHEFSHQNRKDSYIDVQNRKARTAEVAPAVTMVCPDFVVPLKGLLPGDLPEVALARAERQERTLSLLHSKADTLFRV